MKPQLFLLIALILFTPACQNDSDTKAGEEITLILGAYTVPKEAYQKEIIPAFQSYWREKTGQTVIVQESYIASGAQSRAILGGFEADVAALSLEQDVRRLEKADLITHDWKARKFGGFVTRSVVAIAYRDGNPKGIHGWEDLARPGVSVLYPSPKTSGGAMWDVNAIYGAGLKMSEVQTGVADPEAARALLESIQKNVKVMDKSGRASVTTFERGVGDAIVTYENEILLRVMQGRDTPFVIPDATILIENPIAVIDRNADKHGTREVADAFVEFVLSGPSQTYFAKYGFRPVDPDVAEEFAWKYPVPSLLFDIEYLGGWDAVSRTVYGPDGVWTKVIEELSHD